jgi:hypothetical protein
LLASLDQVLRSSPLVVEPHRQIDRIFQIGHEDPVGIPAGLEQLILLGLALFHFFRLLLIAQRHEAERLAPSVRLVAEFALGIGVGLR